MMFFGQVSFSNHGILSYDLIIRYLISDKYYYQTFIKLMSHKAFQVSKNKYLFSCIHYCFTIGAKDFNAPEQKRQQYH